MAVCYTPANAGQLTSTPPDSEGANSCVAYSFSYGECDATLGKSSHSGEVIRNWTNDHNGGLELGQCDLAMHNHAGIEFETRVSSYQEFINRQDDGYGAIVIGGYGPIRDSRFRGSATFANNHAIWLPPTNKAMDPLADGRRAGINKYKGEVYPALLIHEFMAALRLGLSGPLAGFNHVEASYIKMQKAPALPPVIHRRVTVQPGKIAFYVVDPKTQKATVDHVGVTGGFSAACGSPHIYKFPGVKLHSVKLVRLSSGFMAGKYVNFLNPRVDVRVVA